MSVTGETPELDALDAEPPADLDQTRRGLPPRVWIPAIVLLLIGIVLLFANTAIVS